MLNEDVVTNYIIMRTVIVLVVLLALIGAGFVFWKPADVPQTVEEKSQVAQERKSKGVTDGSYAVVAEKSTMNWSAKKPLIEGYVNSGTIAVKEGLITVAGDAKTATFVIDMTTIHVGLTAKKPGQEGKLEEHLKGERWFDVANHPNASFNITKVTPRADSATTFVYDVTGNLTLKGQTHELTMPATIFMDASGQLHAQSSFEFDRTKWGVTAGSASFFDSLADNAVSDMVAMSFDVVAERR